MATLPGEPSDCRKALFIRLLKDGCKVQIPSEIDADGLYAQTIRDIAMINQSPVYIEAGLEAMTVDWSVSPNAEWACRIPGCKQFGQDFLHRRRLLGHLKSVAHDHLEGDYQPAPVDLSTPHPIEFVAPSRSNGVISQDEHRAEQVVHKRAEQGATSGHGGDGNAPAKTGGTE